MYVSITICIYRLKPHTRMPRIYPNMYLSIARKNATYTLYIQITNIIYNINYKNPRTLLCSVRINTQYLFYLLLHGMSKEDLD